MTETEKIKPYLGMTGAEVKQWRLEQAGAGNGKGATGWTQVLAAEWAGIHERTWQRYELEEITVPLWLVKTMIRHSFSFDDMLDRVFDTPAAQVKRDGGVYPELAGEEL